MEARIATRPVGRHTDVAGAANARQTFIPEEQKARAHFFGLAFSICGELGFDWYRRLDRMRNGTGAGQPPGAYGEKYGYNKHGGELAAKRSIACLRYLMDILKSQAAQGGRFLIGSAVSAVDFYWAAFSNLEQIQSPEEWPLDAAIRPMFERVRPEVVAAVGPILIDHRDRIMRSYLKIPMEL